MAYRLSPRLFVEDGPTLRAFEALRTRSARTASGLRPRRPVRSFADGFPVAL